MNKLYCDIVLSIDNFEERFSVWKGRVMTVMGDQIKVSMNGLTPRYFDTIYIYEELGVIVGFTYGPKMPECFISTENGLESEILVDVYPFLFNDKGHLFVGARKLYRSEKLRKSVIGISLIDILTLSSIGNSSDWPVWEEIVSVQNGAVLVKKKEHSYGMCTLDKFPECNLVDKAIVINKHIIGDNIYIIKKKNQEPLTIDFTKKLSKVRI